MGQTTEIAWTDHTFNPWWGCTKVSAECTHCYAETFAKRTGNAVWGDHATRRFFGDAHWNEPLKWHREARRQHVRRRVFCASMADVFEDRDDLQPHRERLWDLIGKTPWLDWLLLTKRPERWRQCVPARWASACWPGNVWFGTTIGHPDTLSRLDALSDARPYVYVSFISAEPLLAPLDLGYGLRAFERLRADGETWQAVRPVDWCIIGGESGPGARPCNVEWIRSVMRQCRKAGTAVFVKQLGAHYVDAENGVGGAQARPDPQLVPRIQRLRHPKGGDMLEWPADLRVREFPR